MKKTVFLFVCLSVFVLMTASKCQKDKPPKALITVYDGETKNVLYGATVKIYSDPTYYNNGVGYQPVGYYDPDERTLYDIKYTDSNGQTEHSFKYESIYSVRVIFIKQITGHGSNADTTFLYGEGALKLENNKTASETVYCF